MKRHVRGSQVSSLLLLVVLLTEGAFAQKEVLQGRVTDPQGNAMPNASVQLIGHDRGSDRVLEQTTTGADGKFKLTVDTSGPCEIRIPASVNIVP